MRPVAVGPEPTSAVSCDAATQLHQTGHWCIAQHFEIARDGLLRESNADHADLTPQI
jgi:hypothetical protein